MSSARLGPLGLSACLLWAAGPAPARAETQTAISKAEAEYEAGRQAFQVREFETARRHFERAYLLDPSTVLLYNLARANEELGDAAQAVEFFQLYLDREPDSADRVDVERRVRVMQAILARQSGPTSRPASLPASQPASRPASQPAPASGPASAPASAPAEGPITLPPMAEEGADDDTRLRVWTWTALGTGAAFLGAGIFFGLRARGFEEDHRKAPSKSTADDAESNALLSNVGFVVGGAFLATAATLWLLDRDDGPTAGTDGDGAFLGWRGRF